MSLYQRDPDGTLIKVTDYSDMIATIKIARQSWLPNRGLVSFVLHKREHIALIPERYFSLLNWSTDELDERHAVVDLMELKEQRAQEASDKLIAEQIRDEENNVVDDDERSAPEATFDFNRTWENLVASAQRSNPGFLGGIAVMVLRSYARIHETNLEKQRARLISFQDFQLDTVPTTPRPHANPFLRHLPILIPLLNHSSHGGCTDICLYLMGRGYYMWRNKTKAL